MDGSDMRMTSYRFSTIDLPKGSQFEAWRTLISSSVELTRPEGEPGFPAELVAWDFGGFVLAEMQMPRRGFHRAWRHLKRPLTDHWCLVLALEDSREPDGAGLQSRSLSFRSLARPFTGHGDEAHLVSLFLPRDQFTDVAARLDAVPATIPDEALGALLADFILGLLRRMPEFTQADIPFVVEATRATVTACLAPTVEHLAAAAQPLALTMVERARREIRRNIEAPGFGAAELCRALGVSRSRLYRLFEQFGGVASYVRRQRLLCAHAVLSDPCDPRKIREIGESFGFGDASGFSRAFHSEFGYTPREVRAASLAGLPVQPPVVATAPRRSRDFAGLLLQEAPRSTPQYGRAHAVPRVSGPVQHRAPLVGPPD